MSPLRLAPESPYLGPFHRAPVTLDGTGRQSPSFRRTRMSWTLQSARTVAGRADHSQVVRVLCVYPPSAPADSATVWPGCASRVQQSTTGTLGARNSRQRMAATWPGRWRMIECVGVAAPNFLHYVHERALTDSTGPCKTASDLWERPGVPAGIKPLSRP
jgi:hypothetical protein